MGIRLGAVPLAAAVFLLLAIQQTFESGAAEAAVVHASPTGGAVMDHRLPVAAETDNALAASDHGPVKLGAGPTRVRLSTPSGMLTQRLKTLPPAGEVYLILRGINTNAPPGITYNVYLDGPEDAHFSGTADPHYVGSFSFFETGPSKQAVFNVTNQVKKLGDSEPTVTVVPAGTPEQDARPTLDKVLLVAAE